MYRHEYIPGSKAEPRVTTRIKARKVKIPMYDSAKPKKRKGDTPEVNWSNYQNQLPITNYQLWIVNRHNETIKSTNYSLALFLQNHIERSYKW